MSEEMNLNGIQELDLEEMEAVSGGKSSKEQIKATGDLNVRTGPGLGYGILGSIKKGEKLPFKGEVKKDSRGVYWGRVEYKGQPGWVSSKYAKLI